MPSLPHLTSRWKRRLLLLLSQPLAALLALLCTPAWLKKTAARGGWSRQLLERLTLYNLDTEYEPSGVIYLHAVSVGETLLALRLIENWSHPPAPFVLAVSTPTARALAESRQPPRTRILYAPLDLSPLLSRIWQRFEPRLLILIESELWPALLHQAEKAHTPTALVNARLSPRSARRLRHLRPLVSPFLDTLDALGLPHASQKSNWQDLHLSPEKIHLTGNLKYDPKSTPPPHPRPEFQDLLESLAPDLPLVLGLSTFPGEELALLQAWQASPQPFLLAIAPRHVERCPDIQRQCQEQNLPLPHLRSHGPLTPSGREPTGQAPPTHPHPKNWLLIDTTGELRDWTAHATVAVVGKTLHAQGGQTPIEAITAHVPLIAGPHYQNFEPLATQLRQHGGLLEVSTPAQLSPAIQTLLSSPAQRTKQSRAALSQLTEHQRATQCTLELLQSLLQNPPPPSS